MEYSERHGATISVKTIITTGETLTPSTRKAVQNFFSTEVFDRYSTIEMGNIPWECPTHTAYHINSEAVVLELLNPKIVGSKYVQGEAVVMCLYRYATPFIRYRAGELVELVDDECPCGRDLPLLRSVEGRTVDCIYKKNGDMISRYAVISRIEKVDGVVEFRVVQDADYSVEIITVPKPESDHERLIDTLTSGVVNILNGLQVRVKIVETLEQDVWPKFRLVESKVAK
ncbi:MAG: hypothetical protein QW240_00525 [Candidatus Caldarchaeum sp.]